MCIFSQFIWRVMLWNIIMFLCWFFACEYLDHKQWQALSENRHLLRCLIKLTSSLIWCRSTGILRHLIHSILSSEQVFRFLIHRFFGRSSSDGLILNGKIRFSSFVNFWTKVLWCMLVCPNQRNVRFSMSAWNCISKVYVVCNLRAIVSFWSTSHRLESIACLK